MKITVEETSLDNPIEEFPLNNLSLAEKDKYLIQLERQIKKKKEMLLEEHNKIRKHKHSENHFLKEVQQDYTKYYLHIKDEKENQIQMMEMINNYLGDIIKSGKLTDEDIEETKREQSDILNSIGSIKDDLDKIIL